MTKAKTTDKIEAETVEIEENQPESVKISENPYLSDEQKAVLIDFELTKLLKAVMTVKGSYTMLEIPNQDGSSQFWLADVSGYDLKTAWIFYKENVSGADAAGFFAKVAALKPVLQSCRPVSFLKLE